MVHGEQRAVLFCFVSEVQGWLARGRVVTSGCVKSTPLHPWTRAWISQAVRDVIAIVKAPLPSPRDERGSGLDCATCLATRWSQLSWRLQPAQVPLLFRGQTNILREFFRGDGRTPRHGVEWWCEPKLAGRYSEKWFNYTCARISQSKIQLLLNKSYGNIAEITWCGEIKYAKISNLFSIAKKKDRFFSFPFL